MASKSLTNLELDVTVISAKHLKNVNWRHGGDLKPYAVVYLDPDRRSATKPDDSGSTKPVWNETLTLPLPLPSTDPTILTLDIFHSKPSETPKPHVATLRVPLRNLIEAEDLAAAAFAGASAVRTLELRRPSGRPQGKVRIKIVLRHRPVHPIPEPNYHMPPPQTYYYSSSDPPPPPTLQRDHHTTFSPPASPYTNPIPPPSSHYPYGAYSDPYYSSTPGYYSTSATTRYYTAPPVPASVRPYYDRYGGSPSAPVDYSSPPSQYLQQQLQKPKGSSSSRMGVGSGLALGAVAGALGGLALQEGSKHEDERVTERVENDFTPRDDYNDYRADY